MIKVSYSYNKVPDGLQILDMWICMGEHIFSLTYITEIYYYNTCCEYFSTMIFITVAQSCESQGNSVHQPMKVGEFKLALSQYKVRVHPGLFDLVVALNLLLK